MKLTPTNFAFAALVSLAFAHAGARADMVSWTYDWNPRSNVLLPEQHGTGGVAFTNEPARHSTSSSTTVVAAYLFPFSAASLSHPDVMTHPMWQLTLLLRDGTSGVRGTMHFAGYLSGKLWRGNESLTNHFVGPTQNTLHLGHYIYTVSIGPYKAPVGTNPGTISARVTVRHNPEPSTLLLAGLGVSALGGVAWRRWRRRPMLPPPSPA